jgi:predicted signal transduction protein with EAL and GGDEF domain
VARQGSSSADADALLHMADIAMYQAKKQGRGHHLWFEDTMASELLYRTELESGIREGIERGEFTPWYEPQIDLENDSLVGFEMLARWHSPAYGLVGPDVFIPIAEEIGVIARIGELLLARALEDARTWPAPLSLTINVSPVQLRDPWFAQRSSRRWSRPISRPTGWTSTSPKPACTRMWRGCIRWSPA